MDEGVRQLRAAIEESEKLAEDVLVIKQRLIDNDKERNKAREAMAALRRAQRAREQQEKQRQEKLGVPSPHGASGTSTAASRGGSSSSIEAQRTQVPTTAAVRGSGSTSQERGRVLLEPTVASRKGSESGGLPGSLLLASNRIEGRILPESTAAAAAPQKDSRSSRSTPLIEELPAPGLELRGPKGGSEPADNTPCSLCGRGGVPGGAQATTRLGSEGASLGGHEARRQQVWMAFPVSGPADGTRAPGFFFLAPQAVVQEQLKRDLATMDSQADELRERQKASLQELSDKGGLDAQGGLIKALTSLKDRQD